MSSASSPLLLAGKLDQVKDLQWRIQRLENLLATKSGKENLKEMILNLDEEIFRVSSHNSNARSLILKADQIQRLTSAEFQRWLTADRATKLELILADEQRIREISKVLSNISQWEEILNSDDFQDIPKLCVSLNQFLMAHRQLKNQHEQFNVELNEFLQDYASFILLMDENLRQYKTIARKSEEDQPMD